MSLDGVFLVVAFSCIDRITFEFIFCIIYSMGELYPNDLWIVSLSRAHVLQEFVFFAVTSVTSGEGFASTS